MAAVATEFVPSPPLPEIKGIYQDRVKDRSPGLRAAGKLTAAGGDTTLQCLTTVPRPPSPAVIRKFRSTFRPDYGQKRVFYGKADDPHLVWAEEMTHGIKAKPSLMGGELLNPTPKSLFKQRILDKKEHIYATHVKAPLGTSHDQSVGLPPNLDRTRFTFGIRSHKDGSAGELVNPNKTRGQINEEAAEGLELYKVTHLDFLPGEQKHRKYDMGKFNPQSKYGIPTPHDNGGKQTKKTLRWLHDDRCEKATPITSKRVEDFRERTQPQLGKVHDPIKDTMHVGPDHVFGILHKPDEYGVGDLLHGRASSNYLRGMERQRGLIAAMRQHLKKCNYQHFEDLQTAFRHYDKNGEGKISLDNLRECCIQFSLPVEPELLEQLMAYCDTVGDGNINYNEFINFLNWKDKMVDSVHDNDLPQWLRTSPAATPHSAQGRLQKQIDQSVTANRTSSSMINAVVGPGGISTQGYRAYGVPSIRSDLPAPRVKRVSDRTNYGDESNAYSLCNPSVFSNQGVYERDVLRPRDKFELRSIFVNIGLEIDHDTFDKLYNVAAAREPNGLVSVEGMRCVLDEAQAEHLKKTPVL